ncbi:MAG: TIGR02266 family protein [Oligoflexus sp.]
MTQKKKTTRAKSSKSEGSGSASTGQKEDRKSQRIPIQLLVDYKAEGHYLFDFCRDLGTGGVFIETKTPLDHGSEVDLTFTLPDSKETLETKGRVIWVQSVVPGKKDLTPGMGVQFEGFTSEQRKVLEKFVGRYHGDSDQGSSTDQSA